MNNETSPAMGRPQEPALVLSIVRIQEQLSEIRSFKNGIQAALSRLTEMAPIKPDPNNPPSSPRVTLDQQLEGIGYDLDALRIDFSNIDNSLRNLI